MITKEIKLFLSKINASYPVVFITGYILLNYIIGGSSLGSNSKLGFTPFFLSILPLIIFCSRDSFIKNWSRQKNRILLFFTTNINVVFFAIGKVNKESLLFKKIKESIGIDFKWMIIAYSLTIVVFFLIPKFRKITLKYYYYPFFFFILLYFFIPVLFPSPHIDLYGIIKNSNQLLLEGINPYSKIYQDIYRGEFDYAYQKQPIKLVYWPLSLYLTAPFQWAFGDFRYAYVFYSLLTGMGIYRFSGSDKKFNTVTFLLLVFTNSFTFYMMKYSWIDLLAIPLFTGFFLTLKKKSYLWSIFFLALLSSLKLYYLFIVPLVFIYYLKIGIFYSPKRWLLIIIFLITIILSFCPFLIIDYKALWYTIEYFNHSRPRYESLSWPGFFYRSGYDVTVIFSAISLLIFGIIYYVFYANKMTTILSFLNYVSVVLLVSFIFAKQAFGNYYYNIVILMVIYFIMINNELDISEKHEEKHSY